MKPNCRLLLTIFVGVFYTLMLTAQDKPLLYNENLSIFLDKYPAEKIYVHTDRDIFSVNDSVWFKIYLTNGHTNVPQAGVQSVYVELIDGAKKIVVRNLILTENGFGKGDFDLSLYKLTGGKYQLRAYTQYQRNFGEGFFFHKNILLNNALIAMERPNAGGANGQGALPKAQPRGPIDLQFLPEGGFLSYGCPCKLAFIARGPGNVPVNVTGKIVNGLNQQVVQFATTHQGMGSTIFIPAKDMEYKAVLDNYPGDTIKLPAVTDKAHLSVKILNRSVVAVNLHDFKRNATPNNYYLITSARGKIGFFVNFNMDTTQKQVQFRFDQFENGINKITLADSKMQPIAERLVFVKRDGVISIKAKTNKSDFSKREKVEVEITTMHDSDTVPANLSVSVVNTSQVISLEQYPQNILSYLLLDSELHGTVANPSFYFKDDSASTNNRLDLVMLTHGWRKYNWNKFSNELPDTTFKKDVGLAVHGKIKRLLSQKGVAGGKVSLFMKSKIGTTFFSETQSDSLGLFRFPFMLFPDSVKVFLQGSNKRNQNRIEVANISSFKPAAPVTFDSSLFRLPTADKQAEFNKMAYTRLAEDKAYHPEKYEIMIDEVVVVKKSTAKDQITVDGHDRAYGRADAVLVVDEKMHASSIWELIGRLTGVRVVGREVFIRGSTPPLFLLDGIEITSDIVDNIPFEEIDKIEALKNPSNLALFGTKGANGVISIFTKRGGNDFTKRFILGIASDKLRGYYEAREFYSPNYETTQSDMPDHRPTIFWSPEILTDQSGKAKFSFFTSDDAGPLLLRIEGISYDGKPGVGFLSIPTKHKNN